MVRAFHRRACASACSGEALSKSLTPGQQVIKAVHDELVARPGRRDRSSSPTPRDRPPSCCWPVSRASGKTTTAAKLAQWWKQQGRNPLLVGADLQRPAAVEQLRVLGRQAGVDRLQRARPTRSRWRRPGSKRPGASAATSASSTPPGAWPSTTALMDEVRADLRGAPQPHYTFLVIDAMTGQDAVATARRLPRDPRARRA